jgi:hypothetical protein
MKTPVAVGLGAAGCSVLLLLCLFLWAAVCAAMAAFICWAFHTPFPPTLACVVIGSVLLNAVAEGKR